MVRLIRCANFSNLPIVPDMPLPISAALRAKSDLLGLSSVLPLAVAFCESVRSDCLCAPTFDDACRFWNWVRTDLNSCVRSWIEDIAMLTSRSTRTQEGVGWVRALLDYKRQAKFCRSSLVGLWNAFRRLGSQVLK